MKTSHLRRSAAVAALGFSAVLSPVTVQAAGVPGQGTWETTLQPRDLDKNGQTDAFYDTALDLTWLRDTNLPGSAGNWNAANAWAGALVFGGHTDWRLPTMVDTGAPGCDWSGGAGGTDCGYNMPSAAAKLELSHLFFVTLGNKSYCDPNSSTVSVCNVQAGWGPSNTADFVGIDIFHSFWLGLDYAPSQRPGYLPYQNFAWYFDISGGQAPDLKFRQKSAMAVHAGDIGAVPEPETYALMLLGLAALVVSKRLRKP